MNTQYDALVAELERLKTEDDGARLTGEQRARLRDHFCAACACEALPPRSLGVVRFEHAPPERHLVGDVVHVAKVADR